MADFPGSVKTFPTLVDLVDSVLALHQNERGGEVTAIETLLQLISLRGGYANIETLSADKTLTDGDAAIQSYGPGGADRSVTQPEVAQYSTAGRS